MKFARVAAIAMLAFLGISAIAGAVPMIAGSLRGGSSFMPLSLLQYSPFHSYLVPGMILLGANGLLALWILWRVLKRRENSGEWTVVQGCVLLGWLVVECWMLRLVMWLHFAYGAVAVVLIVSGFLLRRGDREASHE
jgi:hypothetical protein